MRSFLFVHDEITLRLSGHEVGFVIPDNNSGSAIGAWMSLDGYGPQFAGLSMSIIEDE